jgi:phage host-nuclease inhibitor protein Gam
MRITTWKEARAAAAEYRQLYSRLERLEEELKEFAEARRERLIQPRDLDGVIIGFRQEPATVILADREAALRFAKEYLRGQFIQTVEEIDRAGLKRFMLTEAPEPLLQIMRALYGISLRDPVSKFFVKLRRSVENPSAAKREAPRKCK